jgi:hypothetical protein
MVLYCPRGAPQFARLTLGQGPGEVAMSTMMVALPIKAGHTEAARTFAKECIGPRFAEYDASERRIGIPVENWYLLRGPDGDRFVIQVEGSDLMSSLGAFIASREPFDVWFKEQLLAFTGYDFNGGPPPAETIAESLAEYNAGRA